MDTHSKNQLYTTQENKNETRYKLDELKLYQFYIVFIFFPFLAEIEFCTNKIDGN